MHYCSVAWLMHMKEETFVITDILGVFQLADWPVDAPDRYVRFEGAMVDMICQFKPEYQKLIRRTKRGMVV